MKKLIIFDLDGTIADTLGSIRDAVNMCMEHFGFTVHSYEQIKSFVGFGASELIRRATPESACEDAEQFEKIVKYFRSCYDITGDRVDECYDGMYEVMSALYDEGCVLAVFSNKPDAYVQRIIANLFPVGMISVAMGQTSLPKKPDPTVPLMIAERLGFDVADCYYVGDSEVDVQTARNAGMCAVAVSWGFRARDVLHEADFIADTPSQMYDFLKR